MRLKLLCALVVATLTSAAHAGFIDERAAAKPPAAPSSAVVVASAPAAAIAPARGSVMGMLPVPGWAKPAPLVSSMNGLSPGAPVNFVAVGDAIFRLLPEGHPAVILDGPRDALSTFVTWAPGLSRAEALDQVATNFGLNVNFMGTKPGLRLVISKAAAAPAPSVPSASTVATVVASAPGAATVKAVPMHTFEVRLSDIRLSTSMARWANDNGVRIRWDADKHVLISAPETFTAPSVLAAVGMVLATPGIRNSEYPLEACEYPNTPRLIRITRQGEQAKDCPAP